MFNDSKPPGWHCMTPHQKHEWRKKNNTNSTGFVGVKKDASGKFTAKIFSMDAQKQVHLGTFKTAEAAGAAYEKAFSEIYGSEEDWLKSNPTKPAAPKTLCTWIPIETAKPDAGSEIIAWDGTSMTIATVWEGGSIRDCREMMELDPTHWTSTPKPPNK